MLDRQRRTEIINELYNSFNRMDEYEDCFISIKDISLIFRGGLYAMDEIKKSIFNHNDSFKEEGEKLIEKKRIIERRHGTEFYCLDYYVNLKFLASSICSITDDTNDMQALYSYMRANIENFNTTTPKDCEVSSIVFLS